jgi:SAM-dependent methyltransferase
MNGLEYLMENSEEAIRLDVKTDSSIVERQARWAGVEPGMRVADVCCGAGKTTAVLHRLVQPAGTATGIDASETRIRYATANYNAPGIEFVTEDITEPLDVLGTFDFVWVRFILEYYRTTSLEVVRNISTLVKPGGILCLIDLDHNCLSHYGLSLKLERTLFSLMEALETRADFDPYAGRKLYSYLYTMGYEDISVDVQSHHLLYGKLRDNDAYNWLKKVEVTSRKIGFTFDEYPGGYLEFLTEFKEFFADPGRFTYTPVISARGRRPGG